jgi:hypothetical protein
MEWCCGLKGKHMWSRLGSRIVHLSSCKDRTKASSIAYIQLNSSLNLPLPPASTHCTEASASQQAAEQHTAPRHSVTKSWNTCSSSKILTLACDTMIFWTRQWDFGFQKTGEGGYFFSHLRDRQLFRKRYVSLAVMLCNGIQQIP